jgi:fumarate hydratase subunit beta
MEIKLETPLSEEDIKNLRAGDVVYISGIIYTARDRAHQRIIEEGAPYDLEGSVIFHAGPIIKMMDSKISKDFKTEVNGSKSGKSLGTSSVTSSVRSPVTSSEESSEILGEMVAVGPTTSTRMNPFQPQVIEMGVKAIIGKGGMDENTAHALQKNNAIYLAAVGGCAALYAKSIKIIRNVYWLDLGVPEAIWKLEVENFGPLVVAMDSNGSNLYEEIGKNILSRKNGFNES